MRYFETKEKRPKKLISDRDYHGFRFFLIRVCIVIFILGFAGMFFAWIYRKQWANYRTIQAYSLLFGGIAWFGFMALVKSLGISVRGITYSKLRAILRNEEEQPPDADLFMRKQTYNSLYKMSDDWTLFPTVYGAGDAKKVAGVITGPGGVYAAGYVVQNPKDRNFVNPGKALMEGRTALEKKLGMDVDVMIVFAKHKKRYKKMYGHLYEDMHYFTLQEMNAFISHREPKLDEIELNRINKLLAKMSNADMSQDLDKL
ncbi:MAG: hypothetical protein II969_11015 [Anaerolineaceae bacterium]|nr:hypothetical protein [Anaerolineaceae bacterium]